jgi:ribosome maturation factor RimP
LKSNHVRAGGRAAGSSAPRHDSALAGVRVGWREAIAATVTGLGFELVDIERAQRGLLRIFIDRIPGRAYALAGDFITVEDCEQVTRQLQYVLEVEAMEYSRLEVSSPGLDRPLRREADFERFAGQVVSVTLKLAFKGRKAWQGVLQRAEPAAGEAQPDGWSLLLKDGKAEQVLGFRFDEVREARLVPVVDFKGRKNRNISGDGAQAGSAPAMAPVPGTDGG